MNKFKTTTMLDFSKVKIVEKANPRKPEVEKPAKAVFHLKVDYTKQKLTISPWLFEQLSLEHNSLAQALGPDNELLLIVMPGNSGVFAKAQIKGAKGRSFKNLKFVDDLISRGWNSGKFNLAFLGENEGKNYYSVVPFQSDSIVVDGPSDDVSEVSEAEASVFAEESFN